MRPRTASRLALCVLLVISSIAIAQERGFRLHRFEGTTAGSTGFLVERPWYSSTRFFAVGLTADGSLGALTPTVPTGSGLLQTIVSQALVGHVEVAGSLFDRVLIRASLPVTFLERGTAEPVSQVAPLQAFGLGDPRVGVMARIVGQPERDAFSLHLGADVWVPLGGQTNHQGDTGLRILPRAVLAGAFGVGRWTFDAGFLFRNYASYGPPALDLTAASEARAGLSLGVSLFDDHLTLGPEAHFATQVLGANAFTRDGMALEVLGGASWLIADQLMIGVAAGAGFLGAPGTPDGRALVRVAWAPRRSTQPELVIPRDPCLEPGLSSEKLAALGCPLSATDDGDGDGIVDALDRCPWEPETKNGVRDTDGCPEADMESGTPIARVLAPQANVPAPSTTPSIAPAVDAGVVPNPFAVADADGDGVFDDADRCPLRPEDHDAFEDEDGCPEYDNDGDGIVDASDRCPYEAETYNGLDDEDGCADVVTVTLDADRDGISDALDRCPYEAENVDGVRDDDGCPEAVMPARPPVAKLFAPAPSPVVKPDATPTPVPVADTDGDGLPDDEDRCPATAEDKDDFEDDDGCPEPDNDGDAIADARDRCPLAAETPNGFEDEDGCPDERPDVDGDGVAFADDRCPLEPGDASDGCPHAPPAAITTFLPEPTKPEETPPTTSEPAPSPTDFDKDGLADDVDRCPTSAEDKDGFEDDDGCPEPDNDRDGVPDVKDKCPLEAETINGNKDEDGCPDKGLSLVTVTPTAVEIKGIIQFKTASATLQPSATPLLKQVAATLKAASELSIEIQGHTDDVGNAVKNIALSKKRAQTIRAFLIKAGVAANRLVANGYGPTRPRASNATPAGREQNRRVEFLILGEAK